MGQEFIDGGEYKKHNFKTYLLIEFDKHIFSFYVNIDSLMYNL